MVDIIDTYDTVMEFYSNTNFTEFDCSYNQIIKEDRCNINEEHELVKVEVSSEKIMI